MTEKKIKVEVYLNKKVAKMINLAAKQKKVKCSSICTKVIESWVEAASVGWFNS